MMAAPVLTMSQMDRAAGVLVGQAAGDALGAHYEGRPANPSLQPKMLGGGYGPYEPHEWTDDTQMAICIGRVSRTGAALDSPEALDRVATQFTGWLHGGATDVGIGTRTVLGRAARASGSPAAAMTAIAAEYAESGRAAGNGALMRTAIVGLTRLFDREATARAAAAVAALTHADLRCVESAVLWSEAVRVAVAEGRLDLVSGLDLIDAGSRTFWADSIRVAEQPGQQHRFANNGYTVSALQAAWHVIRTVGHESGSGAEHVLSALKAAVRLGEDTDTVAAIAGGLLGARYGIYSIRSDWVQQLHGWPDMTAYDLVDLAQATVMRGVEQ